MDLTNLNGPYDDEVEEPSVAGTQADSSTSGTSGSKVDQLETQLLEILEETQVPPSDKTEPNLSKKVGEQPTPLKNEAFGLQKMF